jgi:hypothetical protein
VARVQSVERILEDHLLRGVEGTLPKRLDSASMPIATRSGAICWRAHSDAVRCRSDCAELRKVVDFMNVQMRPAEVLAVELRQYQGGAFVYQY